MYTKNKKKLGMNLTNILEKKILVKIVLILILCFWLKQIKKRKSTSIIFMAWCMFY
jgi:hypothetical protein